jgi:uncharacterized protein (TIGR03790 family)
MTSEEKVELERLKKRRKNLNEDLKNIAFNNEEQKKEIKKELASIKKRIALLKKGDQAASLDSEIALVLEEDYPLSRWIPNPHFIGYRGKSVSQMPSTAFMVSRLDGPSDKVVRRIIDDSIEAEKNGLKGKAYFDATKPKPSENPKRMISGSNLYDYSIHLAGERVRNSGVMPVLINDNKELFKPGECPNAALYCGWYSLARYVDAFQWQSGSVGYHIASQECQSLRRGNYWCKMMLEKGVAATIGPVSEPYVQAFAAPEAFFGLLVEGKYTLAECYALSNPFLSWKMVLIGDPLYRPFKNSRAKQAQDAASLSP